MSDAKGLPTLDKNGDVQLCGYFNIPSQPPVPPDQLARIEKQRMLDLQRQRALDEEHAFDEQTDSILAEKSSSVRPFHAPSSYPFKLFTSSRTIPHSPLRRYAVC